jgi:hypothetical protein
MVARHCCSACDDCGLQRKPVRCGPRRESGVGIAPLPIAVGDAESELVRVIDNVPEMLTHFYLLIHPDMQRVPRVRAFCDFVVSEIKTFRAALTGNRNGGLATQNRLSLI